MKRLIRRHRAGVLRFLLWRRKGDEIWGGVGDSVVVWVILDGFGYLYFTS